MTAKGVAMELLLVVVMAMPGHAVTAVCMLIVHGKNNI